MKHLFIRREYPLAPSGGIGTYVQNTATLLAEDGEVVHVIGQLWAGAEGVHEEQTVGRNGMHRYNNQDHSMVTGILSSRTSRGRLTTCGA